MASLWDAFRGRVAQAIAPTSKETFTPTFEEPIGKNPYGRTTVMNPVFFATQETAEWIMRRMGAQEVREYVARGSEPPHWCSHPQRYIYFPAGKRMLFVDRKEVPGYVINAGFLASFYSRNPVATADKWAKEALETDRKLCKEDPLYLSSYGSGEDK